MEKLTEICAASFSLGGRKRLSLFLKQRRATTVFATLLPNNVDSIDSDYVMGN